MLIDDVTITVKAGKGGDGKASLLRNAQTAKGGPEGGNGGNGGDVYVVGVNDITALAHFRYRKVLKAEDGVGGGKNNRFGRNGENLTLNVPIGTHIIDKHTGEEFDVESTTPILLAQGGKGGRGNNEFKSATNQAPMTAEKGEPGQERLIDLELRIGADIGLIGLPNAGKSSLLETLTNAKPKIGDYPFTTLEPNLGVFQGLVLADIPGLIEGASSGKGLGMKFLRHIEKTKMLLHCIDSSQENVKEVYETVRGELEKYNVVLLEKKEIILLTKSDLVTKEELVKKIELLKQFSHPVYVVSILDEKSLLNLQEVLTTKVD